MKLHILTAAVLFAACLTVRADAIIIQEALDLGPPGDYTSLNIPVTALTGVSLSGQEILLNLIPPGAFPVNVIAAPSTPLTVTLNIQTANNPSGPLTLVEGVRLFYSPGGDNQIPGQTSEVNGFTVSSTALLEGFKYRYNWGAGFFLLLPDDPGNTITGADLTYSSDAAFTVIRNAPDGASTAGLLSAGVGVLALVRRRMG